jgi:ParB-like chromosome segregation protein Spo0J
MRRVVRLPTELVVRYRAVDRELVGSPVVDTPSHLNALTESIRARGIRVPLRLGFNARFGALDGNHRIAVALRLGLVDVPVELNASLSNAPCPSRQGSLCWLSVGASKATSSATAA